TRSARPSWRISSAAHTAAAPEAQATPIVKLGPSSPWKMATCAVHPLPVTSSIACGSNSHWPRRAGCASVPCAIAFAISSSRNLSPAPPFPMTTPIRSRSSRARSRPASSIAIRLAVRQSCDRREPSLATSGGKCRRTWSSKVSGTWLAIWTGSALASKPRTAATPDLPAQRLAQFSRLPRPSALTMPMPVITVSVRCIVLPPDGRANRKGGDLVEQRGVREHVGVVPARDTDEALRLVGRREQPLAELEAHHLVTVAVRDQDGNRETPDAGERVEAGDEPERPEALVHVAE